MVAIAGCGHGTTTTTAGNVTVVNDHEPIRQIQNFGDSITCGYFASPNDGTGYLYSNEGYASLFDGYLGVTSANLCRPGDQAADMARLWVYPHATPAAGADQVYTVMIGTNDLNACGASGGCIANWALSLQASLAWLGLPAGDKVLAQNATTAGSWTADLGFGMATTSSNATITFSVKQAVAGRPLYLAYRVFDAGTIAANSATLSIDGKAVDTLQGQVSTGQALKTQNGTTDTVFLETVPLGAAGTHTISVRTSAAGGMFSVLWVGASTQNYASVAGAPRILLSQVLQTTVAALNPRVLLYNQSLATIAAGFVSAGLNITTVPTNGALNQSTDFVDGFHPNTQGHAKLAAIFESVL